MPPHAFLDPLTGHSNPRTGISFITGDLTRLLCNDPVEALVVSAFHDNYTETPTSLIGALGRLGLHVSELSKKRVETFDEARCWISQDLQPAEATHFGFKRIICVERQVDGTIETAINALGLTLAAVAHARRISSIAMPLLGTGNQGYAVSSVVPLLLSTLVRQMRFGSPIRRAVVAVYDEPTAVNVMEQVSIFGERFMQERDAAASRSSQSGNQHDVFISYSHNDAESIDVFTRELVASRPRTTVYQDVHKLPHGSAYNHELMSAIDRVGLFIPFFSKGYFNSPMCGEELASAHIRRRVLKQQFIAPVLLETIPLSSYQQIAQYKSATEHDVSRIQEAARDVARILDEPARPFEPHGTVY